MFDTVPKDSLAPRTFRLFPAGRFSGDVTAVERASNDAGWVGIRVTLGNARVLSNDATEVTVGEDTFSLDGFTINTQYTTEHETSSQAVEIGQAGVIGVANALGIANENGAGEIGFDAVDSDDAISLLSGAIGLKRVGFTVKQNDMVRKDGGGVKQVQRNEDGTAKTEANVSQIFSLEDITS